MRGFLAVCVLALMASPAEAIERLILTSFQPLYSFTAHVVNGTPRYGVGNVVLEKTSAEVIAAADAVVTLRSLPVAPELERVYPWCRLHNLRIVEIDPAVTWDWRAPKMALIPDPEDGAHPRPASCPRVNPHAWLGLTNAVRMVGAIGDDVARLDPAHAERYRANARKYQDELRALKVDAEQRLAKADQLRVATLTEGFPYLTADLGIDVADYILHPKDDAEIAQRVKQAGVSVVLAEEPPEPHVKAAVEKAGARVVVLSTIEAIDDDLPADGYEKAMRANVERLVAAFVR